MAVDKLVDSTQLDSDLTLVADAIRTRGGTSASLAFPAGFVSAVRAIPSISGVQNWLNGVEWADGYINVSGNLVKPTTRAERTTSLIDIAGGVGKIFLFVASVTAELPWMGVSFYDSDGNYIENSRITTEISTIFTNGQHVSSIAALIAANYAYVRISLRTFNEADTRVLTCDMYNMSELISAGVSPL